MMDHDCNGSLAERINRVTFAVDLAEVEPAEVDLFLDSLPVEPFTEEQVERILGRLCLSRDEVSARKPEPRFSIQRTSRKSRGYRLSCEELENRLPPSACGGALAATELEFGMTVAVVPSATVRLWDARQTMEIQGSAESWGEGPSHSWDLPRSDAAAGVAWEALFSETDCPAFSELQLAG